MDIDRKLLDQAIKNKDTKALYDAGYDDAQIMAAINSKNEGLGRKNQQDAAALFGREAGQRIEREYREAGKTQLQSKVLEIGAGLTGNDILKEAVSTASDEAITAARNDALNPEFVINDPEKQIVQASVLGGGEGQSDSDYQVPEVSVTEAVIEQQATPAQQVVDEAPKGMDQRIDEIADKSFEEVAEQFGIDVTMDSIANIQKAQDSTGEDLTTYMPTSILAAYRSGRLGEPTSREAKDRRNYFIMDAVFKGLSNLGSVIAGRGNPGTVAESAYEKYTGESFQRGMDQYFDTKQKKIDQIINEIERDTSISDDVKKSIIDKVNSTEYQTFATKYGEEAASRMRQLMEDFPEFDTKDIEKMYWINVAQGKDVPWQSLIAQNGVAAVTELLDKFGVDF